MDARHAKGSAGELLVAIKLLEAGCEVFLGLTGRESCDLIALKNARCYRVEVKSSLPMIPNTSKSDIHAIANVAANRVDFHGNKDFLADPELQLPLVKMPKWDREGHLGRLDAKVLGFIQRVTNATVGHVATDLGIARPDAQNALYRLWKARKLTRRRRGRAYVYSSEATPSTATPTLTDLCIAEVP